MNPFLIILWAIAMFVSFNLIYAFIGMHSMVQFFPEGRRWWLVPAQLGSLASFVLLTHFHPF